MTNETISTPFFQNYWHAVESGLSASPRHKSAAIRLSKSPPSAAQVKSLVHSLRESLEGPWWTNPCKREAANWHWRKEIPAHTTTTAEVALERDVFSETPRTDWTCQMSTSSGLRGSRTDKRRAIDLVHRLDGKSYQFIELKVGSDNPIYAAFEILGYGLAYCLARKNGFKGSGNHDVMAASRIELVVLAPEPWYQYRVRGREDPRPFDLTWLTAAINEGLAAELQCLDILGLQSVTFDFRCFERTAQMNSTVANVLHAMSR